MPAELAWLLLDGIGVGDVISGNRRSFAFFLDMSALFERFVTVWLDAVLPAHSYRVRSQVHHNSVIWDATAGEPYSQVIPDLLVDCLVDGRTIPVDAKYKRYDMGAAESDIYQAFLYAWALGVSPGKRPARSVLMYPVESSDPNVTRLRIRSQARGDEAEIVVFGIPVSRAIDEAVGSNKGQIAEEIVNQLRGGPALAFAAS